MKVHRRRAVLAAVLFAVLGGTGFVDDRPGLVVHEWGTFTSVMGGDGRPVAWRPLSVSDDLPGFVYHAEAPGLPDLEQAGRRLKARLPAIARLETPVLYFYSARPTSVTARVVYPAGAITEWYPQAERRNGALLWSGVEVAPAAAASFPDDGSRSHYYAARDTDAAPLRVASEAGPQEEGFLFYRGVGGVDLALRAVADGERVRIEPVDDAVREMVLFSNRGGRVSCFVGKTRRWALSLAGLDETSVASVQDELRRILEDHGLYPKEAAAMLATWGDSWFEEGTRIFYVLPRRVVDWTLPLTVAPPPTETVRVLVARLEIVLPEDEERARIEVERLSDAPTPDELADARRRLGRFGEPILRRLAARDPDPSTRRRIQALVAR
jgi:hypothetical protein